MLFSSLVGKYNVNPRINDKLYWKNSANDFYYVRSSFEILEGEGEAHVPVNLLWNPYLPLKSIFFLRKCGKENFNYRPTQENRHSMASCRSLCGMDEDTLDHL